MAGWIEQPSEVGVNHYYDPHRQAGEEISSTYEGRHVYVQEIVLIHAGTGFVQKGQPVAFWEGVGIALKTANSTSENVPIDTEGIWRVSVVAEAAIVIGQSVFINTSGVVTDNPANAMAVFGYSLQAIPAPATAVIAVKVHWMSVNWLWLFWFFMQYSWYGN
jgi:predicted RecA/RadA family phage recombinase